MTVLRDIEVSKISFVGRPALRDADDSAKPQPFILWKSEDGKEGSKVTEENKEAQTPEEIAKAEGDAVKAAIALLRKSRSTFSDEDRAAVALLSKEEAKGDTTEINKEELPPAVRAYIEKQEAEVKSAVKRADEAVAILKAEAVKVRKSEFVAKAETLPHLPGTGTSEEFGELLMKFADSEPEAAVKLIAVLEGTETVLSKSAIWAERGSARVGQTGSAMDKITAVATELRKSEGEDKLSIEQAISKVLDDPKNASLYDEYKHEMARSARDAS